MTQTSHGPARCERPCARAVYAAGALLALQGLDHRPDPQAVAARRQRALPPLP